MKKMNNKGFTIVELVIVIAIVAVLAAILIPTFASLIKKANDSAYLQDRTNQQIADLAEKLATQNEYYLTWEDFEAKLAEEIAKIGVNNQGTLNEAQIKEAIETALEAYAGTDNGLTEEQVTKIIEKALEGSLTTAQVQAIVDAAIAGLKIEFPDFEGLDAEEVKKIVDEAIKALQSSAGEVGITKEQMQIAIEDALKDALEGVAGVEDLAKIIADALAGFGNDELTPEELWGMIEDMFGNQLVRIINRILNNVGGARTAHDAIVAVSAKGYDVIHLTPTENGEFIVWDAVNKRFALYNAEGVEVFPNDDKTANVVKANLFKISNTYEGNNGYAVYLTEDCTATEINATTGVDVGYNTEIVKVNYTGTDEVVIRTDGLCKLTVNDGTVHHYGAGLLDIGKAHDCHAELLDKNLYASESEVTTLFAAGQGTKENPYLINTADQLATGLYTYLNANQGVPTYYKQIADITFTTNNHFGLSNYGYFCGEYDGNGYKFIAGENVSGARSLFDTMGEVTVKNLDLYSHANAGVALFYSTWFATNVTVQNVNFYSVDNALVNINTGNFGFVSQNYISNQHGGENGTILFDNVNVYVDIVNAGACTAAYIGGGAGGNVPTVIFKNCANYGNITSAKSAGVVWGNGSYNNAIYNDDITSIVKFEGEGLKNYGEISATYAHAFGSFFTDNSFVLNELYQNQIGGTYLCRGDLAGDYDIYYDGAAFTINDNGNASGYEYDLIFSISYVYWDKENNSFSNSEKIAIDLIEAASGTLFNTSKVRAYDYNTAIEKGVITSETTLEYTYATNTQNLALYYSGDTLNLIFSPDSGVDYCDSTVSTYLYAYTVSGTLVGTIKVVQ